jgi:hypothetical protein
MLFGSHHRPEMFDGFHILELPSAALAMLSSVSPVESDSRWRWIRVMRATLLAGCG